MSGSLSGSYTVRVTDSGGLFADKAISVTVTAANSPPVWSVPDGYNLGSFTRVGTTIQIPLSSLVSDPNGDPIFLARTSEAADTAPSVVTADTASMSILVPVSSVPAGSYQIQIDATDIAPTTPKLADWNSRATQAGVVWAQRFSPTDTGGDYWMRQGESSAAVCRRLSTDGIINDGCLEIFIPQGQTPGLAGWGRPLAPVQAYAPYGIIADTNPKGLPALPMQNFFSYQGNEGYKKLSNMRGGCFGNAAHFDATQYYPNVPEFVWAGTFWLQFRLKLNAARLLSTEHAGKLFILDHNSGGTAMGEFVQGINADRNPNWPRGMYFYTSQGNYANSELTGPQGNPGNFLPGSTYTACNYPATSLNCWNMPADTWVTFNIGVIPGTQNVPNIDGNGNHTWPNPTRNAGLIIKAAVAGATVWTTLINKTDFYWWYDAQFNNTIPAQWGWAGQQCPNGFNEIRFSQYNGGAQQFPVNNDISVKLDQIICSTVEPALPAY